MVKEKKKFVYSVASNVFWGQNTARPGKSPPATPNLKRKSDTNMYVKMYRNVTAFERRNRKMNNESNLKPAPDIYELLDEIKYLLAQKTKEERLAIFKENEFPKDMDFDYDFGNTVIEVRTFFEGSRDSTVCDTLERIIKEEK